MGRPVRPLAEQIRHESGECFAVMLEGEPAAPDGTLTEFGSPLGAGYRLEP